MIRLLASWTKLSTNFRLVEVTSERLLNARAGTTTYFVEREARDKLGHPCWLVAFEIESDKLDGGMRYLLDALLSYCPAERK